MKEMQGDFLGFLKRTAQQYPDMFSFRAGPLTLNVIADPDALRLILVEQAEKFYKSQMSKNIVTKFLGDDALVILDGDYHKQQRRLVQPAFHARRIEAYAAIMVDYTRRFIGHWREGVPQPIDVQMSELAMQIVAKTLFDADVSDVSSQAGQAMSLFADLMAKSSTGAGLPIPEWIPTRQNIEKKRTLELVDSIVADMVKEHRAAGDDRGDLLSMLLMTQDEDQHRLSDQQILDQTKSLFFAGHETTAKTLTWTFYALSQHPDVEARLHEEVDRELAGRPATAADLARLPYTERVIKEAMRLYPPAWILDREPIEDVVISGFPFKKGSRIFLSPYLTHHNPRWWSEPERFDPERFTEQNEKGRHRYAYIPFGAGPRVCLGNTFAMMEAILIVATVAQQYRLSLADGQQVEVAAASTLYPKYGMKMVPKTREQVSTV
jgi:cytochrome P450